jgi:hypothetical protein
MAGFSVVPLRSLPPPRGHRALPGSQPRRSLAISIPRASSVPALSVRFPSLHALASAWTRFLACPAGGGTAPSQTIVCRNTEPLVHSYQVAASVWPFGPLEMGDAFPGTGQLTLTLPNPTLTLALALTLTLTLTQPPSPTARRLGRRETYALIPLSPDALHYTPLLHHHQHPSFLATIFFNFMVSLPLPPPSAFTLFDPR